MSSVIKMDVPQSCAACKLSYLKEQPEGHYDRICPLLQFDVSVYNNGRPADCWFMKQLPKNHGNLKDIDAFIKTMDRNMDMPTLIDQLAFIGLVKLLDLSPTIIEAEPDD